MPVGFKPQQPTTNRQEGSNWCHPGGKICQVILIETHSNHFYDEPILPHIVTTLIIETCQYVLRKVLWTQLCLSTCIARRRIHWISQYLHIPLVQGSWFWHNAWQEALYWKRQLHGGSPLSVMKRTNVLEGKPRTSQLYECYL
jgi:hypothetical protein